MRSRHRRPPQPPAAVCAAASSTTAAARHLPPHLLRRPRWRRSKLRSTFPTSARRRTGRPAQPEPPPPQMPGAAPGLRVEPMSNMRQKIAEHMIFSKRTSAHVTTVHKVDITKVAKLREKLKGQVQAQYGFSLTYLPFVIRAATAALRQFPIVNASIDGTNIIYHRDINVGMAVALENGLIVPVIRNADEKNVIGLQRTIVDLAARSRSPPASSR